MAIDPSNIDAARERLQGRAPSPYLDVFEVAEFARCEHKAVRKAIHEGRLPAFATNRKLLVHQEDARAWVESRPARAEQPRPARRRAAAKMTASVAELRQIRQDLTGES